MIKKQKNIQHVIFNGASKKSIFQVCFKKNIFFVLSQICLVIVEFMDF